MEDLIGLLSGLPPLARNGVIVAAEVTRRCYFCGGALNDLRAPLSVLAQKRRSGMTLIFGLYRFALIGTGQQTVQAVFNA